MWPCNLFPTSCRQRGVDHSQSVIIPPQIQRVELEEELERQKNRTANEIEEILHAHAAQEEQLTQALRHEYESLTSERAAWDKVL